MREKGDGEYMNDDCLQGEGECLHQSEVSFFHTLFYVVNSFEWGGGGEGAGPMMQGGGEYQANLQDLFKNVQLTQWEGEKEEQDGS